MTPNEMRIAAAESAGFVWYRHPGPNHFGPRRFLALPSVHEYEQPKKWTVRSDGTEKPCTVQYMAEEFHLPAYTYDLNATTELIKTLKVGHDGSDAANYQETLYGIVNPGRDFVEDFCAGADVAYLQAMLLATPLQQLEAYLKVKELWK